MTDEGYESLDREEIWDEELASDLVGSTLYVGLEIVDGDGIFQGREQIFGTVQSVSKSDGIKLRKTDGEIYTLAPVLNAIEAGEPDRYQLNPEDELVENPDFVAWIIAFGPKLS